MKNAQQRVFLCVTFVINPVITNGYKIVQEGLYE